MSFQQAIRHRDFAAGLFFLLLGLAVAGIASRYPIGTAMRMGPGYFPTLLGAILALLGLGIAIKALRANHALDGLRIDPLTLRPALMISGGVLLFAGAIQVAGLALSTMGLVFVSGGAHRGFRWPELALSAVALSIAAVGIFAYGLRLPFRILPF